MGEAQPQEQAPIQTNEVETLETNEDVPRETSELEDSEELEADAETDEDTGESELDSDSEEAEAPLKFKRKVNGKLVEATEDELWKHYGLEVTARERTQAAAKRQEELDQKETKVQQDMDALAMFFKAMKSEPKLAFELLNNMGHDAKQIARDLVLQDLEYDRMTPAEKKAFDNEKKLKEYEEKEGQRKKVEEEHQKQLLEAEFTGQIDTTLSEAIKLSGFQPKPLIVARMAEACQTLLNASKTGELPPADKVLKKFLANMQQDFSQLLSDVDLETLERLGYIPDNFLEKASKRHLEKNKLKLPSFQGTSGKANRSEKSEPKKKPIGINAFFDKLGSK